MLIPKSVPRDRGTKVNRSFLDYMKYKIWAAPVILLLVLTNITWSNQLGGLKSSGRSSAIEKANYAKLTQNYLQYGLKFLPPAPFSVEQYVLLCAESQWPAKPDPIKIEHLVSENKGRIVKAIDHPKLNGSIYWIAVPFINEGRLARGLVGVGVSMVMLLKTADTMENASNWKFPSQVQFSAHFELKSTSLDEITEDLSKYGKVVGSTLLDRPHFWSTQNVILVLRMPLENVKLFFHSPHHDLIYLDCNQIGSPTGSYVVYPPSSTVPVCGLFLRLSSAKVDEGVVKKAAKKAGAINVIAALPKRGLYTIYYPCESFVEFKKEIERSLPGARFENLGRGDTGSRVASESFPGGGIEKYCIQDSLVSYWDVAEIVRKAGGRVVDFTEDAVFVQPIQGREAGFTSQLDKEPILSHKYTGGSCMRAY